MDLGNVGVIEERGGVEVEKGEMRIRGWSGEGIFVESLVMSEVYGFKWYDIGVCFLFGRNS